MIYHVLPGDAQVAEFQKTGLEGEVIVCREALVVGPVDGPTPTEFWQQRAAFILSEYAEDEIEFHEKVADELERLRDVNQRDEVNLWFEYELFCSVNLWYCLSVLCHSGAQIYRVHPAVLDSADRWDGFGRLDADDLAKCYADRIRLSDGDTKLGADLWRAFSTRDFASLRDLSGAASVSFPYLAEVVKAAGEIDSRPAAIVAEIEAEGTSDFGQLFPEFTRRAGVYGFGDLQVRRLVERKALG